MKRSLIVFLTCLLCRIMSYPVEFTTADSLKMKNEADSFLAAIPADLQKRQCAAVLAAIDGDRSLLAGVRNSRNKPEAVSPMVRTEDIVISTASGRDLTMRLFAPADSSGADAPLPLLVYFHGGGWTFGSINSCTRFCDALASEGHVAVLAVDYALAPEHPYPEGLHDCVEAINYAVRNSRRLGSSPDLVSAGGDSSGGNLAVASALYMADHDLAALRSLILFYPVLKAEEDLSDSWSAYGSGFGLDSDLMNAFNKAYVGDQSDAECAYVSPAFASVERLAALPPVLMVAAGRDILTSQGCDFAARVSAAGGVIGRVEIPGTVHLFITVRGQETAFRKAVSLASGFLSR